MKLQSLGYVSHSIYQIYDYIQPPVEPPLVRPYLEVSAFDTYGLGALFSWSNIVNTTLESRIGISFISRERACRYIAEELPASKTFEGVVDEARMAWEVRCVISFCCYWSKYIVCDYRMKF